MSDTFDPYYKWLGIPPNEQPPNHYRLLGLNLWEADPDVISNAADKQMAHVTSFQRGRHSDESQRLLNEIAAARVCLLLPIKKAEYDGRLTAKAEGARASPSPIPATSQSAQTLGNATAALPRPMACAMDRPKGFWLSKRTLVGIGVSFAGILALLLFAILMMSGGREKQRDQGTPATQGSTTASETVVEQTLTPSAPISLAARLAGTKWVNLRKATFEWTADGRFLHNGIEREWKVLDDHRVYIVFGPHKRGTLTFNDDLTKFTQGSKGSSKKLTGKRQ